VLGLVSANVLMFCSVADRNDDASSVILLSRSAMNKD